MKLTKFQKHLLERLAGGDKLSTDTRRNSATIHRDDLNHTRAERVPFHTLATLLQLGAIEHGDEFYKRGEYTIHWYNLTAAGRESIGVNRS